ncbi:hypothetical protein TYRP_008890 [Tyrophagus putrescentiae]|nr:hypothetical protein TYRP_008890 [Tyrophagus putrescentiae]
MATGGRHLQEQKSLLFLQVLHVELLDLLLRLGGDVSLVIRIGTRGGGGGISAAGNDPSAVTAITTTTEDDHLLGGANDVALPGEEAKAEEDAEDDDAAGDPSEQGHLVDAFLEEALFAAAVHGAHLLGVVLTVQAGLGEAEVVLDEGVAVRLLLAVHAFHQAAAVVLQGAADLRRQVIGAAPALLAQVLLEGVVAGGLPLAEGGSIAGGKREVGGGGGASLVGESKRRRRMKGGRRLGRNQRGPRDALCREGEEKVAEEGGGGGDGQQAEEHGGRGGGGGGRLEELKSWWSSSSLR